MASLDSAPVDWQHVSARVATFFLLSGSLGYLSQRERLARLRAEALNEELREHQSRLEKAYDDLRATQARLVELERLATIGQMFAKVSHEVRNPLSSISLNTELLEDELESLPEGRRAQARTLMAAIRSQLDVLSAVTEEYLRFARLPKPRPEPTSLAALIEELAEFLRPELAGRRVTLALRVAEQLPVLPLDPGQIRAGVRQGERGRVVEIAVEDEGVGIHPEAAARIFEPFFTTKEGGTGLGLAIARQIAADHGGLLSWEPAPNGGTIFRLVLAASGEGTLS
jgi:signal transduction histidine kinase